MNGSELKIYWYIKVNDSSEEDISNGAYSIQNKNGNHIITFNVNKLTTDNPKLFNRKLVDYIQHDIDIDMYHEVKHVLDKFDGIFSTKSNKKYIQIDKLSDFKSLQKYHSQDKEVHNFLISVISELKLIKEKNPDISFNEALSKSKMFEQVMMFLDSNKVSKFKSKVVYLSLIHI